MWVAFILLTQALVSAAPHVLWMVASRRAGLSVAAIIDTARQYQRAMYAEPRDNALRYLVSQVRIPVTPSYVITRLAR